MKKLLIFTIDRIFLFGEYITSNKELFEELELTKEKCVVEVLKYKNKVDFCKSSNSVYQYSYRNGFLNEICKHMVKPK